MFTATFRFLTGGCSSDVNGLGAFDFGTVGHENGPWPTRREIVWPSMQEWFPEELEGKGMDGGAELTQTKLRLACPFLLVVEGGNWLNSSPLGSEQAQFHLPAEDFASASIILDHNDSCSWDNNRSLWIVPPNARGFPSTRSYEFRIRLKRSFYKR